MDAQDHLVLLRVHNKAPSDVYLYYVDESAEHASPTLYTRLAPMERLEQQTYPGHAWQIRDPDGAELVHLRATTDGASVIVDHPFYARHADDAPLRVRAHRDVARGALDAAAAVVGGMLRLCPPPLLERLRAADASVAVIGRSQLASDVPEHAFTAGDRRHDWSDDATCRGFGGNPAVPVTSVGEENLVDDEPHADERAERAQRPLRTAAPPPLAFACACCGGPAPSPAVGLRARRRSDPFAEESLLVHELAHCVMDVGLDDGARARIRAAHAAAVGRNLVHAQSYAGSNASEYWAEGAQAWFDAGVRCDVNCGLNTREELVARDPLIADELRAAFGEGEWRYPDALEAFAPRRAAEWERIRARRCALRAAWGRLREHAGLGRHRVQPRRDEMNCDAPTTAEPLPAPSGGDDEAAEVRLPRVLTRYSHPLCEACGRVIDEAQRRGLPWSS